MRSVFTGRISLVYDTGEKMNRQPETDNQEWKIGLEKIQRSHGFSADPERDKKRFRDSAQAKELALEILKLAQHTLLIDLRFLEAAFVRLAPERHEEMDTLTCATDGRFFYYNSVYVCREYRRAKELPVRAYLHTVLHCVYRHLFVGPGIRRDLWDLAADIAVENLINELNLKSLYCERQAEQEWILADLRKHIPQLSAEWIYKYYREQDIDEDSAEKLRRHFLADDHAVWYRTFEADKASGNEEDQEADAGAETAGKASEEAAAGEDEYPEADEKGEKGSAESLLPARKGEGEDGIGGTGGTDRERTGPPALTPEQREELQKEWKNISERVQLDLDTFSESWGEGTGDMKQTLKAINREKYDYARLLQRFAVLGENMELNDDEFDYIFYTYGMKLYGRMPLIEPLEYREVKRVREFVIALDTSESVSGEIVQKFVTKTWNILKQTENFFSRVNVHIIQCGARVEEDVRIATQEEFDRYISHMVLKGFGGTDFRPVFEHIDTLIRQHEFQNFRGLIYFTDGYGSFPSHAPDYDACFIFLDQGHELPEVPVWAIKMLLKEDEIRMF
mgnify:CR=1 FL=1